MKQERAYRTFVHKEASLRICSDKYDVVVGEIVRQRALLEEYIRRHPDFQHSLTPLPVDAMAPAVAQRMAKAAQLAGVGPMAAVAGAMAQLAVEAAIKAGAREAIVDNGGDIYLQADGPVTIGIYAGKDNRIGKLAFWLKSSDTPLSICASSGKMGHSLSLGQCDLAVVVAKEGALADAAATRAANLVTSLSDVEPALRTISALPGVSGVLIVQEGYVGLAGQLPRLVKRSSA